MSRCPHAGAERGEAKASTPSGPSRRARRPRACRESIQRRSEMRPVSGFKSGAADTFAVALEVVSRGGRQAGVYGATAGFAAAATRPRGFREQGTVPGALHRFRVRIVRLAARDLRRLFCSALHALSQSELDPHACSLHPNPILGTGVRYVTSTQVLHLRTARRSVLGPLPETCYARSRGRSASSRRGPGLRASLHEAGCWTDGLSMGKM